MRFLKETVFPVSADTLWAFHERKDAFELLVPPWQKMEVIQPPASLEVGTKVILRAKLGPLWKNVVAEHIGYDREQMTFTDTLLEGPFAKWIHRHVVTAKGDKESLLTDDLEYELPLGPLGKLFGGWYARRELERLFAFRHEVTRKVCLAMERSGDPAVKP